MKETLNEWVHQRASQGLGTWSMSIIWNGNCRYALYLSKVIIQNSKENIFVLWLVNTCKVLLFIY